ENERPDVLRVGTGSVRGITWDDPRIDIEIQAANRRVLGRVVPVAQFRSRWKIILELHPVASLHDIVFIDLNESVQLAVGDAVEHPSIGADTAQPRRKFDQNLSVA